MRLSQRPNGFVLAQQRDDAPARGTLLPSSAATLPLHLLAARLLRIGGTSVLFPPDDPAYMRRLLRGERWTPGVNAALRRQPGAPSQCHRNTARWWEANAPTHGVRVAMVTGYALTPDDGLWREHTWGLWLRPRAGTTIVETTVARSVYFGLVLTPADAELFLLANE